MSRPEDILQKCGYYSAAVHGYSMYPLLLDHRDTVYIEKADTYRKYDVVLFRRADNTLVLHRVIGRKGALLKISGDNDLVSEWVDEKQILGVMTSFSRNGVVVTVDDKRYRRYSRVWNFSPVTKRLCRFVYKRFHKHN